MPPAVSARKIDGERAYKLARRGEHPAMRPAPVTIPRIDADPREPGTPELRIRVTCGAGTYIRAIARDLGRALGTAAHLAALRRVQIGAWHVDRAIAMDRITAAAVAAVFAGAELIGVAEAHDGLLRPAVGLAS